METYNTPKEAAEALQEEFDKILEIKNLSILAPFTYTIRELEHLTRTFNSFCEEPVKRFFSVDAADDQMSCIERLKRRIISQGETLSRITLNEPLYRRKAGLRAGGAIAWENFLAGRPKGWDIKIGTSKYRVLFYFPVEPFPMTQEGLTVRFSWIAIQIYCSYNWSLSMSVRFKRGRRHSGAVPLSPHPHCMNSNPPSFCLGEGETAMKVLAEAGDIRGMVGLAESILKTPAWDHVYYPVERYTKIKGGRCTNCKEWSSLRKIQKSNSCVKNGCYVCDKCVPSSTYPVNKAELIALLDKRRVEDAQFMGYCKPCLDNVLRKYRRECRKNKKEKVKVKPFILCKTCIQGSLYHCEEECGTTICSKHSKRCTECLRKLCPACVNKCLMCSKSLCSNHYKIGKGFCDTCSLEADKVKKIKRKIKLQKKKENKEKKNESEPSTSVPTATHV